MSIRGILYSKGAQIITIDRNMPIEQAARLMQENGIGALPVTDGEKVVGMISSREIVSGIARHGAQLAGLHVCDLMLRSFVRASVQDSLRRVIATMRQHRATHIPVFDGTRLAGIVSLGDVVKHRLDDLELESNVLRDAYIAAH